MLVLKVELISMIYKHFDGKFATHKGLTESVRKFKKHKVYPFLRTTFDSLSSPDLEITLISEENKGTRSLLCIFGIFSKHARITLLKERKGIIIINVFQKGLSGFCCKLKKICVG